METEGVCARLKAYKCCYRKGKKQTWSYQQLRGWSNTDFFYVFEFNIYIYILPIRNILACI